METLNKNYDEIQPELVELKNAILLAMADKDPKTPVAIMALLEVIIQILTAIGGDFLNLRDGILKAMQDRVDSMWENDQYVQ